MAPEIVLRVAARYQRQAREFTSPEALKDYLHEHPQADKSKHTVKDHGEDDHGGGHEDEAPKKSWRERLKGLSEKAANFVKNAPKAVHKFIEDENFRRKTAQDAHKALTEAPEKFVKGALKTVKDEIKEYKEAGQGIAALMKGEKMNAHQKKALKTVATHMAIGVAAAALTASGPLAAAGMLGKGMAKHVAMKAVSNMLGKAHVLEELGHIGHGVKHILEKFAAEKKEPTTDEVLSNLVAAAVAKELEGGISDADLKEAIEEAAKGSKEASWKAAAGPEDLLPTMEAAVAAHADLRQWVNQFPNVLRASLQETQGLPDGWVWQDRFVKLFQGYDAIEERLRTLDDRLEDIYLNQDWVSDIANVARSATAEPPPRARVSYAINDFQFFEHPHIGRDHIAYDVDTLKEWATAFEKWVTDSVRMLQVEMRKAKRRIQRRAT